MTLAFVYSGECEDFQTKPFYRNAFSSFHQDINFTFIHPPALNYTREAVLISLHLLFRVLALLLALVQATTSDDQAGQLVRLLKRKNIY